MKVILTALVVLSALGLLANAPLAETPQHGETDAVSVINTTARLGQLCHKKQLQFLLEGELPLSEEATAWAADRRLVVRHSAQQGMVVIHPPRQVNAARQVPDLLGEITQLMMNVGDCPDGARSIPVSVAVEGLDIVEEDGEVDFRVMP